MINARASHHLVVAMPAIYRPELLATTLWSFDRGLFRYFPRKTLILNLDPLGTHAGQIADQKNQIMALANTYFDQVIVRFAEQPSFSRAVQWVWQQATEKENFFLHLEDDWVLNRTVPFDELISLLQRPGIASVRLQRQRSLKSALSPVFSLNPIFFNSAFIRQALTEFRLDLDPEKQFGMDPLTQSLSGWKHMVMPQTFDGASDQLLADPGGWVSDLGVHWRKGEGLRKISAAGQSRWEPAHLGWMSRLKNRWLLTLKLIFYRRRALLRMRRDD